jgi:hypothetical protein
MKDVSGSIIKNRIYNNKINRYYYIRFISKHTTHIILNFAIITKYNKNKERTPHIFLACSLLINENQKISIENIPYSLTFSEIF